MLFKNLEMKTLAVLVSQFTFFPMAFLQQVSNKWPSGYKALQNHIGKATAEKGQTRKNKNQKKEHKLILSNQKFKQNEI